MNLNSVRKSWAPLALFLGVALFAVSGNAQTAAPQEEKEVKMEKYVVTGSYIPAAADESEFSWPALSNSFDTHVPDM